MRLVIVSLLVLANGGCAAESWGVYAGPPRAGEVRMMEPHVGWSPGALSPTSVGEDAGIAFLDDGAIVPRSDSGSMDDADGGSSGSSDAGRAAADASMSEPDAARRDAGLISDITGRPCFGGSDCRASEYCNRLSDRCGVVGTCVVLPDCSKPVAVCGCDSVSYPSVCSAASAGASVGSVGACP